jgi:hypothetical protein
MSTTLSRHVGTVWGPPRDARATTHRGVGYAKARDPRPEEWSPELRDSVRAIIDEARAEVARTRRRWRSWRPWRQRRP